MTIRAKIEAIFEPQIQQWRQICPVDPGSSMQAEFDRNHERAAKEMEALRDQVLSAIEEHEKEIICREYRVELPRLAEQLAEQQEPKLKWPCCEYPECDCEGQSKVQGKWYCGPHSFMVANQVPREPTVPVQQKGGEIKWITGQPYRNTEP